MLHGPPLLGLQPSTRERKGTRPFIRLCRKGPPVSTLAHGLTVMRQGAERVGLKGLQLGALGRSIFVFLRPKRSGRCIGKRPRSDSRQKPLLAPGPQQLQPAPHPANGARAMVDRHPQRLTGRAKRRSPHLPEVQDF